MSTHAPAVVFDPDAFRVWLAGDGQYLVPVPELFEEQSDDPAHLAEDLLTELGHGNHPEVWRHAPGVSDTDIYRTADSDGVDGGGMPTAHLDNGLTLAGAHLPSGDLVYGYTDGDPTKGRGEMDGVAAAIEALTAVASSINKAYATYRASVGGNGGGDGYLVRWEIDVDAAEVDGPRGAADYAWAAMRRPGSIANVFTVVGPDGTHTVDLDLERER